MRCPFVSGICTWSLLNLVLSVPLSDTWTFQVCRHSGEPSIARITVPAAIWLHTSNASHMIHMRAVLGVALCPAAISDGCDAS